MGMIGKTAVVTIIVSYLVEGYGLIGEGGDPGQRSGLFLSPDALGSNLKSCLAHLLY